METPPIHLATRQYDCILQIAMGDVRMNGADVTLIRSLDALNLVYTGVVDDGEFSFSPYFHRVARGNREYLGLALGCTR